MVAYAEKLVEIASAELKAAKGRSLETWGSNWGPRVKTYQSVTGAYKAAWCVSFVQWCLKELGVGAVANRTAGALYLAGYAAKHKWVVATPRPGDIYVRPSAGGHAGIVTGLTSTGRFKSIDGNWSNSVRSNTQPLKGMVFIRVPSVVPRPRWEFLPRFQIVGSVNSKPRVLVGWGKWSKVGPQVPTFAAKYREVRVQRKVVKALVA